MLLLFVIIFGACCCLAGERAGAEFRLLHTIEADKQATFQSFQPKMVVDGRRVYFEYLQTMAKDGASTVRLAFYDGHGLAYLDQRQGHITSGCLLSGGRMLYHLFNGYQKQQLHLTVYRLRADGAHLVQRKVYPGFVSAGKVNAALAEGTIYVADAYGGLWLINCKTLALTPRRKVIPEPGKPLGLQYPHIALDGKWLVLANNTIKQGWHYYGVLVAVAERGKKELTFRPTQEIFDRERLELNTWLTGMALRGDSLVLAYTRNRNHFDSWGYFRNLESNIAGFSVHDLVTGTTRHQTLDDDRIMSGSLLVHGGSLYLVSMSQGLLKIYRIDDSGSARKIKETPTGILCPYAMQAVADGEGLVGMVTDRNGDCLSRDTGKGRLVLFRVTGAFP